MSIKPQLDRIFINDVEILLIPYGASEHDMYAFHPNDTIYEVLAVDRTDGSWTTDGMYIWG